MKSGPNPCPSWESCSRLNFGPVQSATGTLGLPSAPTCQRETGCSSKLVPEIAWAFSRSHPREGLSCLYWPKAELISHLTWAESPFLDRRNAPSASLGEGAGFARWLRDTNPPFVLAVKPFSGGCLVPTAVQQQAQVQVNPLGALSILTFPGAGFPPKAAAGG